MLKISAFYLNKQKSFIPYKIYEVYTVVRAALWICGGKPCPFHLMSLPSEYEAKVPAAGNFSLKQRIQTSEAHPQSLREKTMPRLFTIHALK